MLQPPHLYQISDLRSRTMAVKFQPPHALRSSSRSGSRRPEHRFSVAAGLTSPALYGDLAATVTSAVRTVAECPIRRYGCPGAADHPTGPSGGVTSEKNATICHFFAFFLDRRSAPQYRRGVARIAPTRRRPSLTKVVAMADRLCAQGGGPLEETEAWQRIRLIDGRLYRPGLPAQKVRQHPGPAPHI